MKDSDDTPALWQRDEIESPCVKLCGLHPETQLCVGCARSGEEIAGWSGLEAAERRRIMAELPTRVAVPGRRGGAAQRRAR
ncbi:MAG: DUF1289 domain-containing protein [Pseudomonadota bacterium]